VNGYDGSLGNDVFWNIYSDAAMTNQIGQSTFHLSCSDDNMDGPEDCGQTEGNAKAPSAACRRGPMRRA